MLHVLAYDLILSYGLKVIVDDGVTKCFSTEGMLCRATRAHNEEEHVTSGGRMHSGWKFISVPKF